MSPTDWDEILRPIIRARKLTGAIEAHIESTGVWSVSCYDGNPPIFRLPLEIDGHVVIPRTLSCEPSVAPEFMPPLKYDDPHAPIDLLDPFTDSLVKLLKDEFPNAVAAAVFLDRTIRLYFRNEQQANRAWDSERYLTIGGLLMACEVYDWERTVSRASLSEIVAGCAVKNKKGGVSALGVCIAMDNRILYTVTTHSFATGLSHTHLQVFGLVILAIDVAHGAMGVIVAILLASVLVCAGRSKAWKVVGEGVYDVKGKEVREPVCSFAALSQNQGRFELTVIILQIGKIVECYDPAPTQDMRSLVHDLSLVELNNTPLPYQRPNIKFAGWQHATSLSLSSRLTRMSEFCGAVEHKVAIAGTGLDLRTGAKAVFWRTDFDRGGASGSPLVFSAEDGSKRVVAFQNFECRRDQMKGGFFLPEAICGSTII
ncbi:hypothetical protein HK104_001026 [Borealophlyctis nickersoniae]|nr:hypothetical protein HK104_001026 [Borealophlyctis nickersoniae]